MTTKNKPVIAMMAPVTITAGEQEDGPKRFDVVAYTGGPLVVGGYELPVVVDLDGLEFGKSIIANLDHDRKARVGHVTDRINEGGELKLGGFASAATSARNEVVESAAGGFVWQASIEAVPKKLVEVKKGKEVEVNGQTHKGPIYLAEASTLKGFAFVSHGADDNTQVTIAATRESEMNAELKAWIEGSLKLDVESLTDEQVTAFEADFEGRQAPPKKQPKKSTNLAEVIAEQEAENERVEAITALSAEHISAYPHNLSRIKVLAELAIDGHWDVQKFELELLRLGRPQAHGPLGGRRQKSELTDKIMQAALCRAGGLSNIDKHFDDQTLDAVDARFANGIGIKQLLLIGAKENGFHTDSLDVNIDVQRAAFGYGRGGRPIEAAAFSTLSIPSILAATANKFLVEGWMAIDQTWAAVSSRRSVRDFKTVNSYSLTGGFSYEEVGPGGELKHGTVGETTYTNKADTYGKMFAITRTDIINDDLDALTAVPRRLGRGAALKLNNVFWTEFLNNTGSHFTSGNSNVSTGAGSALALAGLSAAEVVFMNQTDPDGHPLGMMPAILLVPTTLKTAAMELMQSSLKVSGNTTAAPDANVWQGRYAVASSPYMENTSFTGYSAAAWYLLANPSDLSTIEVCFLNGRETPVVETADADFNVLGVQMRGYHDFGVNLQEVRAGVRSAGS